MKAVLPFLLLLAGCADFEPSAQPSAALDVETLQALPHVATVEVSPAKERKRQIIHILDWHFVNRVDFEADMQSEAEQDGNSFTDAEIGRQWGIFIAEVIAVQAEQTELLQELVQSHGLKSVFLERLTEANLIDYRALAAMVRKSGETGVDSMYLGTASRIDGLEVLPAEDAQALDAANPVKDGKVQWDETANERREDAIVRNVLASESPVAVLVMSGGHDLSENVERIGNGQVEYVRFQVEAYRKVAEN